jgi:cytochrome o ubiquinol oxidase subunit 3
MLAAYHKKQTAAIAGLLMTLVLGMAFLLMEGSEFAGFVHMGHSWRESAFLSSFFTLVGTHGLHVFVGILWMLALLAHIALKGLTGGNVRKLICLSLFWHFLDVVWIFIFTFVYLLGVV